MSATEKVTSKMENAELRMFDFGNLNRICPAAKQMRTAFDKPFPASQNYKA